MPPGISMTLPNSSTPKPISWYCWENRSSSGPRVSTTAPISPPARLPRPPTTIIASTLIVSKVPNASGVMCDSRVASSPPAMPP